MTSSRRVSCSISLFRVRYQSAPFGKGKTAVCIEPGSAAQFVKRLVNSIRIPIQRTTYGSPPDRWSCTSTIERKPTSQVRGREIFAECRTHGVDAVALWRLFDRALVRRDRHHRQLLARTRRGKIFAECRTHGVDAVALWRLFDRALVRRDRYHRQLLTRPRRGKIFAECRTHGVDAVALWRLFDRALVRRDRYHRQLLTRPRRGKIFAECRTHGVDAVALWRLFDRALVRRDRYHRQLLTRPRRGKIFAECRTHGVDAVALWRLFDRALVRRDRHHRQLLTRPRRGIHQQGVEIFGRPDRRTHDRPPVLSNSDGHRWFVSSLLPLAGPPSQELPGISGTLGIVNFSGSESPGCGSGWHANDSAVTGAAI